MSQKDSEAAKAIAEKWPEFYGAVSDFPDFCIQAGISDAELDDIEKRIDYKLPEDIRALFKDCSEIRLNGLKIAARELGSILMPGSEGLLIGEFYLRSAGDRLLMLPDDAAIYYLEQRNGAITKLAANLNDFFSRVLPECL